MDVEQQDAAAAAVGAQQRHHLAELIAERWGISRQECDEIALRKNPLPWVCYASPVAVDEEVVRSMARAGCEGVEVRRGDLLAAVATEFAVTEIVGDDEEDVWTRFGGVNRRRGEGKKEGEERTGRNVHE